MENNDSLTGEKAESNGKLRIAAVADIHVRENDRGKWVDYFKDISRHADVLILGGDLTDTGDESEAQVLSEELRACAIPVVGVLGNHDYEKGRHKLIRKILQNENVHILDGEGVVIKGIGFAGIKGFGGGFDNHMLSMFGEGAYESVCPGSCGRGFTSGKSTLPPRPGKRRNKKNCGAALCTNCRNNQRRA
jgi:hypothetical protein